MSNNGEDIIRETFEKLSDVIGVQMQIPDAMIANLGAVLQAQIDLLAELQSAGRLIPDGGMALTAEQVEDVRALVWLDGRRNFDAFHRLRALFPATEPAEEATQSAGGDCFDVCEGHPAPAEPAEEETKAELPTEVGDRIRASVTRWSSALEWPDSNPYIDTFVLSSSGFWDAENDQFTVVPSCFSYIEVLEVLPSPVVPAPTETGPWQRIEDVPDGVEEVSDCDGHLWRLSRNVVEEWHFDGTDPSGTKQFKDPSDFAPLFAVKEES